MNLAWETLAPGVHRCRLAFLDVSVGVVAGSAKVLLIDCGTTLAEAQDIAGGVAALTGRAVTDIVLTHRHFDHVLGSAGFPLARLLAAPAVVPALTTGARATGDHAIGYGADPGEVDAALAGLRRPDPVVGATVIDLGGRVVEVCHPGRGHTDHDLVVLVPGSPPVMFCGDLVEESADPAIGEESDLAAWPRTLDRVLEIGGADALYVPGHGAVVDAAFVRRQRDWLTTRCAAPARGCRRSSRPTRG